MNNNNLLHPNQHGFRENHSCQTALTSLVDTWLNNIEANKYSGAVFVDFMKAFDTISHELLLRKLKLYGLSANTIELLSSYLSHREQITVANNKASSTQTITHGVPQGSVLGPLLFSIYINDLPLAITGACEMFADDTTIHSSDADLHKLTASLQESLNCLQKWSELNHMAIHPTKSKAMLITTRQKRQNLKSTPFTLYFGNQPIQEEENHTVLGVTIDNNLTWSKHISAISKTISKKDFFSWHR